MAFLEKFYSVLLPAHLFVFLSAGIGALIVYFILRRYNSVDAGLKPAYQDTWYISDYDCNSLHDIHAIL